MQCIEKNISQICGKSIGKLTLNEIKYYYTSNKLAIEQTDCTNIVQHEFTKIVEIQNKQMILPDISSFDPLAATIISNLISLNPADEFSTGPINLVDVVFCGRKLSDMDNNKTPDTPNYITLQLNHYNCFSFSNIARTKKSCGLFLVRDIQYENILRYCSREEIAKNVSSITSQTKFLIDQHVLFEDLCTQYDVVHEVTYIANHDILQWVQSSKALDMLLEFKVDSEMDFNENSIRIIYGASTSGKSVHLNQLKKVIQESDASKWISLINGHNLKTIESFNKSTIEVLFTLFDVREILEKSIFHHCAKIPERLVLLIDNLDDVLKPNFDSIANFLLRVSIEYPDIIVWITSRNPFKNVIQSKIPILEHKVAEMNVQSQLDLIKHLLNKNDGKALQDTLTNINAANPASSFSTNPYNLTLCVEKILKEESENSLNCLDVYDFYIKQKLENSGEDISIENLCSSAAYLFARTELDVYIEVANDGAAFQTVFGEFKEHILIQYLTALCLMKKPQLLTEDLMFQDSMITILDFFDKLSFRHIPLGEAVINSDYQKVVELCDKQEAKLVKDLHGRNLLHIIRNNDSNILEYLLKKEVPLTDRDHIIKATPEKYYIAKKALSNLEILVKNGCDLNNISEYLLKTSVDTPNFIEDLYARELYSLCKLIIAKKEDFQVTPYTIYCITNSSDNKPNDLVLMLLNKAKEQGLVKLPAYVDYNGETALHNVARNSEYYVDVLKVIVEDLHYDVNGKDFTGSAPLLYTSNIVILKYLIEKGADPYTKIDSNHRITPFNTACQQGNLEIVKFYIDTLKTDLNVLKNDVSPLFLAASSGNLDLIKYLYKNGFNDVNVKDFNGETPLHAACISGDINITKYLISCGADVNIVSKFKKRRPIDVIYQSSTKNSALYDVLLDHGSHISINHLFCLLKRSDFDRFKEAIKECNELDWNSRHEIGETLLHCCVQYVNDKSIIEYIAQNSDLEQNNENDGATALQLAFSVGNEAAIEILLKLGADLFAVSERGETVIHFAVQTPLESSFRILFKHQIDINAKDNTGRSAVHCFGSTCNEASAKILLDHGLDVNSQDNEGKTALHEVCKNNYYYAPSHVRNCLQLLRVNPNIRDKRGRLALHYAVENNNVSVIRTLAKYAVLDVNIKDHENNTALALAINTKNEQLIKFLETCKIKYDKQN